jgi:hypothetical protein
MGRRSIFLHILKETMNGSELSASQMLISISIDYVLGPLASVYIHPFHFQRPLHKYICLVP